MHHDAQRIVEQKSTQTPHNYTNSQTPLYITSHVSLSISHLKTQHCFPS